MSNTDENLTEKAKRIFRDHFQRAPEMALAAPGRSNLIGEHTDYNEGHVLPIAIDRHTVAVGANREDRRVRLYTGNLDEHFEWDLDRLPEKIPHWVNYVIGILVEMEEGGYKLSGKDIAVYGDLPVGSGLSSSAALEISVGTLVERMEHYEIADAKMVDMCRRGDHRFVGVKCGPMDQFASRACRTGHAGLLDCRSMEMRHHRLPEGLLFLSLYTGIPRALAASEYNERFESCQGAVRIMQKTHSGILALRDAAMDMVENHRDALGDRVYKRARHVVTEQNRVFRMIDAFESEDLESIGEILHVGHRSLSEDYEVSLPVLDEMIDWLYGRKGVVGARLTGAGFGGSLICLVRQEIADTEDLIETFIETFRSRVPEKPEVWVLKTVNGARYN